MHQHSADCVHPPAPAHSTTRQSQLILALALILGFAAIECLVGISSHSLVLVADSGHMASDGLALGLALTAVWLSRFTAHSTLAAKHPRWETWAALVNGIALSAIAVWIGWEAIARLHMPPTEIASLPMLLTAGLGAGVNGVNVALLHQNSEQNLNLKAAFWHVLADTLSCIGVLVAAIAVSVLHWIWADGAISLLVAGLILYGSVSILTQTVQTLRSRWDCAI